MVLFVKILHATYEVNVDIALRRFMQNHGNIVTEGSHKPGLCSTLTSNDLNV